MLYIRFIKRLLLILIVCLFALNIQAMRFRHLSMPDGLSQLSVLSIYQDRLGRMWFGTEEGVKYGYGYKEVSRHESAQY